MKKTIYLILTVVAMVLMGCGQQSAVNQGSLEGCDMAIFENGKVTFYNSTTNTFIPFVAEKEYITSGAISKDQAFYYTVLKGDKLYLKQINLVENPEKPVQLTDWGLKKSDCYAESLGEFSPMCCYGVSPVIGIGYGVFEDSGDVYAFLDTKFYNAKSNKLGEEDEVSEEDDFDVDAAERYQYEDNFVIVREEVEVDEEEEEYMNGMKNYFFYVTEEDSVCLSDQIDFADFYEAEFELLSISPSHECIAYGAPTSWGFAGTPSGPLCFATLDGKVQKALDNTDFANICYGWLSNGKLAYSDMEGIKTVSSDGTVTLISPSHVFVTK